MIFSDRYFMVLLIKHNNRNTVDDLKQPVFIFYIYSSTTLDISNNGIKLYWSYTNNTLICAIVSRIWIFWNICLFDVIYHMTLCRLAYQVDDMQCAHPQIAWCACVTNQLFNHILHAKWKWPRTIACVASWSTNQNLKRKCSFMINDFYCVSNNTQLNYFGNSWTHAFCGLCELGHTITVVMLMVRSGAASSWLLSFILIFAYWMTPIYRL